jgi:ribosomal protein L27
MAKKKAKKAAAGKKVTSGEFIISKSRTKAASGINVSGDFYAALDGAVRMMIKTAERRATDNGRKTLRPQDL